MIPQSSVDYRVEGNSFHSFVVVNTVWVYTNSVVCFLNITEKKPKKENFLQILPPLPPPVASFCFNHYMHYCLVFPSSERGKKLAVILHMV